MYPVYTPTHTARNQNDIAVSGDSRGSESANFSTKTTSDDLTNLPVDEVRLSGAVRKIMAAATGVVNSQSAALLASKVASSDPALAKQAFGRIISAVTFSLLTTTDSTNPAPEKHVRDVQEQDRGDTPPNLADNDDPAAAPASDVLPLHGGNIATNEKSDVLDKVSLRDINVTTPLS